MGCKTYKLSLWHAFVLVLGVTMLWRYFGAILFTILKVVITRRSFLLSSSDLRERERVPDGLPKMVRMALFWSRSTWSDSCLEAGSQTEGQYSRWGSTSDLYIFEVAKGRCVCDLRSVLRVPYAREVMQSMCLLKAVLSPIILQGISFPRQIEENHQT